MFGFGKKKTGSLLVIRSEGYMTTEGKVSLIEDFQKLFPEHKVVVLSGGTRVEFVKTEAP